MQGGQPINKDFCEALKTENLSSLLLTIISVYMTVTSESKNYLKPEHWLAIIGYPRPM